jgi:ceramide glucosyltransferase
MPVSAIYILAAVPAVSALGGICYSFFTLWCAASFRSQKPGSPNAQFTPPISILKPLCGMDPHAYESLRSHCTQDYPVFEIIFGVADPDDQIIPAAKQLIAEFPAIPIRIVYCPQRLGSNLKVSNLIQMLPNARYDYLLINDSDIKVPDDYLRRVAAPMESSSVGMVTCLYRGVAGRSIGSKLESLGIASDFIPGVLCAKRLDGGVRFGMGSTLAFSRRSLDRIGGLSPIADFLADDYQLGHRMAEAGLRVELADCVVDHYLPEYSFSAFLQHQLRWARAIRTSRPGGYAGMVFTFVIPWSLLTILFMPAIWAWLLFTAAVLLRYAVSFATEARVLRGRGFDDFWLLPFRDVIAAGIWIMCYMGRQVIWRGKRFDLINGKLREI